MDTSTLTVTATGADADAEAEAASVSSSLTLTSNLQLCRICISSNVNSSQMISIFGEDSLWRKIATLADVKIERGDILPQQVCLTCAKNTISACLFKKKCEDADSFYRQQLFLHKIEHKTVPQDNCGESEGDDELINGQNHHLANDNDDMSSHSYKHHHHHHGLINGDNNSAAVDGGDEEEHETHPPMTPSQFKADPEDDEHDDDDNEEQQQHVDVDANGEVKGLTNGLKPAFDFNSIRLMHEYMQQHLSKFNGLQGHATTAASDDEAAGHEGSDSDQDDDDDGPLPLIPEIELITPSEDCETGVNNGNALTADGQAMTQMRGYQCPHCYQIFEMKQVLKAHMQSVHGAAGPVYECTNCKKTYFYKRFLEKHIRRGRCVKKRRNQTRPMQCSDCNVLFPTGHHLGWHKRTGCPSKTAKMPLQQLFKQNIVQYNNFPRRGARKPENALYLHNRKLVMANNKRKGRTRIKLDARKIALAKQLILREATTTVIANELNISRTFAWRLRKSLVNGVSLHERVIDPTEEEDDDGPNDNAEEAVENVQKPENLLNHHPFTEHFIKSENIASDEEDGGNGGDHDDSETDLHRQQQTLHEDQQQLLQNHQHDEEDDDEYHQQLRQQHNNSAVATSVIQRTAKTTTIATNKQIIAVQLQQQQQEAIEQKLHNISVVQQQRLMELKPTNNTRTTQLEQDVPPGGGGNNNGDDAGTESNGENEMTEDYRLQQQQQQETDLNTKCGVNSQQYLKNNSVKSVESPLGNNGKLPLITQLSPAVAAAIHQLPVNLSIRPIASMQNTETSPTSNSSSNNNNNNNNNNANKNSNTSSNGSSSKKKPRKPNVFIDDEKYAMAKMLVAQNASTMEIAKALNVSQMTAWKLRDAIIKGVPLSYRNKRDIRMTMVRPEEDASGSCGALSESSEGRRETEAERQQQTLLVKQQLEHQQKLQQQHLQQQQQIQQLLQRQQQLQQQQQQLEQQKLRQQQQREEEEEEEQRRQQQLQQQQQQQLKMQQQQKQEQKNLNPRRRLKAAEREVRDKEITREILELIKEDNNIQYWKVSARLAEKGYAISPSSVCQKLKSMGIHRRWKPGDKPPLIDMEHLKANTTATTTSITLNQAANSNIAAATLAAAAANAASSSADESYEQQFDMGGAHFLSAFTR